VLRSQAPRNNTSNSRFKVLKIFLIAIFLISHAIFYLDTHEAGVPVRDLLSVVIVIALLAVIVVMMIGLFAMGQGGDLDKMVSTRLMWARVGIQALAIALLILAVYLR